MSKVDTEELVASEKEIKVPNTRIKSYSFRDMLLEMDRSSEFLNSMDETTTHLHIRHKSTEPQLKIYPGDLHVGNHGVSYKDIIKLVDLIFNHPYIGVGIMGDLYDNFLRFPSLRGADEAVWGPSKQIDAAVAFLLELERAKQLDFMLLGNHGVDREEKAVGYSVLKKAMPHESRHKIVEGRCLIELQLGRYDNKSTNYKTIVSHKGLGNSSVNPCHSAMRLARVENYPDSVIVAHTHNPAIIDYYEGGHQIICARTGTFKLKDAYSERNFDRNSGRLGIPSIIYYHDPSGHKKMIGFLDPFKAVKFYKAEMGY